MKVKLEGGVNSAILASKKGRYKFQTRGGGGQLKN